MKESFESVFKKIKKKVITETREFQGSDIETNKVQLKALLKEAHSIVLNEIDHRVATKPMVINMDAEDELDRGNDIVTTTNGKVKRIEPISRRASEITYEVLTQGVKDNVGDSFELKFGRKEIDGTTSEVVFTFKEVRLLTKTRFVIEGNVKTSRCPNPLGKIKPKRIQIDYHFDNETFYEAVYCANGTIRDKKPLKLRHAGVLGLENVKISMCLINFLTNCLYSIEDGEKEIENKHSKKGKHIV